ncbi:iron ABC transporter permease [Pseudonocardia sp. MCCB 268]|nr:iron ABC transporter permease [Pseudonocardia cytotoxica]
MSMVLSAALTVLADLIARTALGSVELPVGIVTAVLGAHYLLYLLAPSPSGGPRMTSTRPDRVMTPGATR